MRLLLIVSVFALAACDRSASDTPPATARPVEQGRYIFMPPMDDGGISSGLHAVTICLPAGYDATDRRYPVLYLLDGEAALMTRGNGVGATIGYEMAHDQLVHDGLIHPAILVAVHNGSTPQGGAARGNRGLDYRPWLPSVNQESRAEGYFTFLSTQLKPMIDRTYRTKPEPASTGVAGFSASGLGAFWMTYLHPEVFGMALCQSPDLRMAEEFFATYPRPKPPVRLWIDVGSREIAIGLLVACYDASRALIAQGFRQNVDLAFQIGRNHGHEKFNCNQRMRAALYFLLRTQEPTFTGAEIVEIDATTQGPIHLSRPGRAVLETRYDEWFRLTDCTAVLMISDPANVTLGGVLNELRPVGPGSATLTAMHTGREITQTVTVPPVMAPMACAVLERPVTVDGDLSEWQALPIDVTGPRAGEPASAWTGPADLSYRFACAHDERFLYLAIQTTDDLIASTAELDPWFQDGVEVRIDARPSSERLLGGGAEEFKELLLLAMSPAKAGETRQPFQVAKLPPGIAAVCVATAIGHQTELAIPFAYLDEQAGGPWCDVRVNVVVNDLDDDYSGFRGDKLWWQADWRTPGSAWGSGTFTR
ncbi:MAG: hypothetical protein H0W72_03505 [Planctomycetes bacterium]|nr:hypothetical protein [Planctomycetota bacterium]